MDSKWPELHQSPVLGEEWPVGCNMRCSCSGGDIATVCDTDEALRRLRGGAEAPWHVPDRMQVRFMNQAATIPRLAQDSVLGKDAGVPREALP